jgi:hypothetical protein
MVSSPKHFDPIIVFADDLNSMMFLCLLPIVVIMIGKSTVLLILKISLVPILKMMMLIIVVLFVLSMVLPMMMCLQMNTLWKIAILLLMMILYL